MRTRCGSWPDSRNDTDAVQVRSHYLWFNTENRQGIIDITDDVAEQVAVAGIREGFGKEIMT